ncbi:hypothetical protein MKX03_011128 [Papaver bracteatum]|nr:hypothetical protein MKX03_011128 [Papaver bracteatum]
MDRFSELPDFLIQHILSFLQTKFVVSTTVLSKRWKNLWIHVPTLDFCDSNKYVWGRFLDFVDRLLILRNMSPIHKFRFIYDRENWHFDPIRVKKWIATAVKCNVEAVILSMRYPKDTLPVSLFTSESLIRLDIHFPDDIVHNEAILDLPQSISFPRLRILRLSGIVFQDGISVQQLFSSCPLLEDLCLVDCFWNKINLLSISAPALKYFTLDNILLPSSMLSLDLKINAPNLMSIKYYDWLPLDLVVDKLPSLVHADLCFQNTFDNNYNSDFDFDLLSKFITKLSAGLSRNTVDENAFTSNLVPRCLLLHLRTIKVRKFKGVPEELNLVKYFLENARILEVLILESGTTSKSVRGFGKNDEIMELDLMYPRASPSCKVKFFGFS